ncbi:MAG: Hpt domain-containing protein [Lentisphaerae bacterium]|nr:Hpt domain-containing protein [Lentisphaerota bacterium]
MPTSPVFDTDRIIGVCGGRVELIEKFTEAFVEFAPEQYTDVEEATNAGDAQAIMRTAHKLKGAAANIGGDAVTTVAAEMEAHAEAGDVTACKESLSSLKQAFEELLRAIRETDWEALIVPEQ